MSSNDAKYLKYKLNCRGSLVTQLRNIYTIVAIYTVFNVSSVIKYSMFVSAGADHPRTPPTGGGR